jgi:hypothetical protein
VSFAAQGQARRVAHEPQVSGARRARLGRDHGADGRPVRGGGQRPARPGRVAGRDAGEGALLPAPDRHPRSRVERFAKLAKVRLCGDTGFAAVQQNPGVRPGLGAVFCAEIGEISRFAGPTQLASWAGRPRGTVNPTPRSPAAGSPSRAPNWSAGPPSRSCSGPARTTRSARRETGSPRAARRPANQAKVAAARYSSSACSTPFAAATSAACRYPHRSGPRSPSHEHGAKTSPQAGAGARSRLGLTPRHRTSHRSD